jgi:pimeloyl-ACP methyl ester carboxylesterase
MQSNTATWPTGVTIRRLPTALAATAAMFVMAAPLGIAEGENAQATAREEVPSAPTALDSAASRFAKVDDVRVHWKCLGPTDAKEALVLVHGWTCDLTFWRENAPELAKKMRVVLVDLPGHGKSDKLEIEYSMDLFARAVDSVLRDAGVERAVLAGHSMGTPVVRHYLRLFPARTAGLVSVDGALRPMVSDPEQAKAMVARFEGPDYRESIGGMVDGMFPPEADPELREATKKSMQSAPQHVAVGAMRAMLDPAIWKDDPIDVPLLVVNAESPYRPDDYEAQVRRIAPKMDYRTMEGVGHFLMLEKPAEFDAIVAEFATRVFATPRADATDRAPE